LGFWKPLQRTMFFLSFQLRSVWRMRLEGRKAVLVRAIALAASSSALPASS
jgi:hypothetical protein